MGQRSLVLLLGLLLSVVAVVAVAGRLLHPEPAAAVDPDAGAAHVHGEEGAEPALPTRCTRARGMDLCGPEAVAAGESVVLALTAVGCGPAAVDFGDGTTAAGEPGEGAFGHVYDEPGTYAARIVVAGCGSIGTEVVVEASR